MDSVLAIRNNSGIANYSEMPIPSRSQGCRNKGGIYPPNNLNGCTSEQKLGKNVFYF